MAAEEFVTSPFDVSLARVRDLLAESNPNPDVSLPPTGAWRMDDGQTLSITETTIGDQQTYRITESVNTWWLNTITQTVVRQAPRSLMPSLHQCGGCDSLSFRPLNTEGYRDFHAVLDIYEQQAVRVEPRQVSVWHRTASVLGRLCGTRCVA